jgi:hypothetical protein
MLTYQRGRVGRRSGTRPAGAVIALLAVVLAVAGCSQVLPIGPGPHPAPVQRHLGTPIVLQLVRSQPSSPAGRCPAGSATLQAAAAFPGSGQCYRKIGTPLTITSAAVTYVQQPARNQQPASYGLMITVPAGDRAALLAITTKAYRSRDALAIIAVDKTWGAPHVASPFTVGFEIPSRNRNQALQLERKLVPSA